METKQESITSCAQLETTISNKTNGGSTDDDAAHGPVPGPDTLLPLTVNPARQHPIPPKEPSEVPEEVIQKNKLSGIQETLTDQVDEFRSKSTEKEKMTFTGSEDHKLVETTVAILDTAAVSQKDIALVNYFMSLQLLVSLCFKIMYTQYVYCLPL